MTRTQPLAASIALSENVVTKMNDFVLGVLVKLEVLISLKKE